VSAVDRQFVDAQGLARQIRKQSESYTEQLEKISQSYNQDQDQISTLTADIQRLEQRVNELLEQRKQNKGLNARSFLGDGDRQYLTGLKLGGERILILLDSSASMLDFSIVNIIRLRNMNDEIKRNAEKWRRALATVQWLVAQLPTEAQYQLYTFNTTATPALPKTRDKWLEVSNAAELEDAVNAVSQVVPTGGTSLETLFLSVLDFSPLPDNIFLLTDGLPTQGGRASKKTKVSGKERMKLFEQAISHLPASIPFNIILAPLEGDPMAASAFWQLAQQTEGAFLSPSKDWP
jgi:hypothetical protein